MGRESHLSSLLPRNFDLETPWGGWGMGGWGFKEGGGLGDVT